LLNRLPVPSTYNGVVSPTASTQLEIPLPSRGNGEQRFELHIDGPLARVGSGPADALLTNDSVYLLTINPNGLLTENMLVTGELVLSNDAGAMWTYPLELKATDSTATWPIALTPGQVIAAACWLVALYAALATREPPRPTAKADPMLPQGSTGAEMNSWGITQPADAWGRPIDEGRDS